MEVSSLLSNIAKVFAGLLLVLSQGSILLHKASVPSNLSVNYHTIALVNEEYNYSSGQYNITPEKFYWFSYENRIDNLVFDIGYKRNGTSGDVYKYGALAVTKIDSSGVHTSIYDVGDSDLGSDLHDVSASGGDTLVYKIGDGRYINAIIADRGPYHKIIRLEYDDINKTVSYDRYQVYFPKPSPDAVDCVVIPSTNMHIDIYGNVIGNGADIGKLPRIFWRNVICTVNGTGKLYSMLYYINESTIPNEVIPFNNKIVYGELIKAENVPIDKEHSMYPLYIPYDENHIYKVVIERNKVSSNSSIITYEVTITVYHATLDTNTKTLNMDPTPILSKSFSVHEEYEESVPSLYINLIRAYKGILYADIEVWSAVEDVNKLLVIDTHTNKAYLGDVDNSGVSPFDIVYNMVFIKDLSGDEYYDGEGVSFTVVSDYNELYNYRIQFNQDGTLELILKNSIEFESPSAGFIYLGSLKLGDNRTYPIFLGRLADEINDTTLRYLAYLIVVDIYNNSYYYEEIYNETVNTPPDKSYWAHGNYYIYGLYRGTDDFSVKGAVAGIAKYAFSYYYREVNNDTRGVVMYSVSAGEIETGGEGGGTGGESGSGGTGGGTGETGGGSAGGGTGGTSGGSGGYSGGKPSSPQVTPVNVTTETNETTQTTHPATQSVFPSLGKLSTQWLVVIAAFVVALLISGSLLKRR